MCKLEDAFIAKVREVNGTTTVKLSELLAELGDVEFAITGITYKSKLIPHEAMSRDSSKPSILSKKPITFSIEVGNVEVEAMQYK